MNSNSPAREHPDKGRQHTFYAMLAELLEVEAVKSEDVLTGFELWDSLTVLSLIATLDANYGVNLTSEALREIKTAGELALVVEKRQRQ